MTEVRDTIRDPCEDMDCGPNSESCSNGVCKCKDGFEGSKCEVEKERCSDEICNNGTVEPGFVSDGCKCTCSNGWGNEEGWQEDTNKICAKRIRSSLKILLVSQMDYVLKLDLMIVITYVILDII